METQKPIKSRANQQKERKVLHRNLFLMVSLGLLYNPLFFTYLVRDQKKGITNCILDSYHNDAQLNDSDYGLRVTKECWAFGIHMDDFLEHSHNGRVIYLRKHPKNESRSVQFYARYRDEIEFVDEQILGIIFIGYIQVFLAFLSERLALRQGRFTTSKIIHIFTYLLYVFWFFKIKLLFNGEYSTKHGLHFDLLAMSPRLNFKVDKANLTELRPIFTEDKVKFPGPFKNPSLLYNITTYACFFGFLVISIGAVACLIQLISWILPYFLGRLIAWIFPEEAAAEFSKNQKLTTKSDKADKDQPASERNSERSSSGRTSPTDLHVLIG